MPVRQILLGFFLWRVIEPKYLCTYGSFGEGTLIVQNFDQNSPQQHIHTATNNILVNSHNEHCSNPALLLAHLRERAIKTASSVIKERQILTRGTEGGD